MAGVWSVGREFQWGWLSKGSYSRATRFIECKEEPLKVRLKHGSGADKPYWGRRYRLEGQCKQILV